MRKRVSGLVSAGCLLAGLAVLSPPALAGTGNRFSVGAKAGGGSVAAGFQSWRAGFELGFRAGKHLAVAADLTYGALTLENSTSSTSGGYSALDSQEWTAAPVTLSVLYAAALGDNATAYLGGGAGYHVFSRTVASETQYSGQRSEESRESTFNALAPQAVAVLEFSLGKSVSLVGALAYVFGTASREETRNNLATSQDINFGGVSLTLGVRLYLF